MLIYKDLSEIKNRVEAVITIGTFDGIHLGHLEIFNELKYKANELGCESLIVTFEPHPRTIVSKDFNIQILTTSEERYEIFESTGINHLLVINFSRETANLTAEEFLELLMKSGIVIKHVVIGYDHRFGKNRSGDAETLKVIGQKHNFDVTTVSAIKNNNDEISSTKVRRALSETGDIDLVTKLLGRFYSLKGSVASGAGRGRKLGFPTANIKPENEKKLIPRSGVYLVRIKETGEKHFGIMNIGFRPTFGDVSNVTMEVFIFDFNKDIYDTKVEIEFLERIRDERKFESVDELVKQVNQDIEKAKNEVNKYTN